MVFWLHPVFDIYPSGIFSHQHENLKPYLPYNIDHGTEVENSLMNNLFHLSVWAIAHSIFARDSIKVYVTKIIPQHLERPLYVFQSSYLLHNGITRSHLVDFHIFFSYQELVPNESNCLRNPRWLQEYFCRILYLWLAVFRKRF